MSFTYVGTLSTDRDKVRFYVGDRVYDSGPLPKGENFEDAEIDGVITNEGTWERAVGAMLDMLAAAWSQHADIAVGPRRESFSQVAAAYAARAGRWRAEHRIYPGIKVAGVVRVDGYSDDEPSDDVETTSEYGRVKIHTWEYPL